MKPRKNPISGEASRAPTAGPQNDLEAAAVERYMRKWKDHVAPSYKPAAARGEVEMNHPDAGVGATLIAEGMGSPHPDLVAALLRQLKVQALNEKGHIDVGRLNFVLALILDIKPRDAIESMIAMRMAAVHELLCDATLRLNLVKSRKDRDAEMRDLLQLGRLLIQLAEALRRRRASGEQRVTVVHQHVHDGGKAIGVVDGRPGDATGGRGAIDERSHAPSPLAGSSAGAAMLCALEEERGPVPGTGDEG